MTDYEYRWRESLQPPLTGLEPGDWYMDGGAIDTPAAIAAFNKLDWNDVVFDMGPSPTGNIGPYCKVAMPSEGTRHRLYPKLLESKWANLVRCAIDAFEK